MADTPDAPSEPRSFSQERFQRPPETTDVILVRHGQSQALIEGQAFPMKNGQGDPPLSALGRRQAEMVADRLADEPISAIYVSSMTRTHETAAPLAGRLGLTPVEDHDLREVHLGDWEEGVLRRMAAEGHPTYLRMHAEQRWDVIPGAESTATFTGRLVGALDRIVATNPGGMVAVFVHGGVIGALLAHGAGLSDFTFGGSDNGAISQVVIGPEGWNIRRFNDAAHIWPTLSP